MQFPQNPGQSALRYQGRYYPLNKSQISIGCDPNCDIPIEHNPRVLPIHAQIIAYGGLIYVKSMERGAVVWVNGSPALQQVLQDQDTIAIGDQETRLTFQLHWNPNGAEQTAILAKRVKPITGRNPAYQAPANDHYSSQQYEQYPADSRAPGLAPLSRTRQAPLSPQDQASPVGDSTQGQVDFPTQRQVYAGTNYASPAAGQDQASPGLTASTQWTAANTMHFPPQSQMPPEIASTPPLGATPGIGMPPQTPQAGAYAPAYPQQSAPLSASNSIATNTTRYLCAAGHLDEGFQDYVMRHVIYEERRALGETYGVDMLAVVSWCKAGIQRINIRDIILTILLALSIVFPAGTFITLIMGAMTMNTATATPATGNPYYTQPTTGLFSTAQITGALAILAILSLLPVLLLTFGLEAWVKRRWPRSHPGIISLLVVPWFLFPSGLLFIPLGWLVILGESILRFYGPAINNLRKHTFNPQARPVPLDPPLEARLRASFTTDKRNMIAYSGYRPFAGAGDYLTGWSFVIDTSKGAPLPLDLSGTHTRQTPRKFTTSSLYAAIERDVRALGLDDVLEIEGKLYVRGQYLPEHQPFFNAMDQRPMTNVDQSLVDYYKENPTEDIRYYLCMRFNSWRGEIIFSAFLRLVQRGKNLFVEFDYLLLPPMQPDYYWVDEREITPTAGKIWELFLRSFDKPIKILLGAPYRLLRGTIYSAQQNKLARVARNNPAFDYGAATSVRYIASDTDYHLFFQKLDKEMYLKTIQKQMLETIYNFLNEHQIDTSDFNRQQQTILNAGTIVSGREVNIGAMSTGAGGQATNTVVPPAPAASAASQPHAQA
jgi:hypothetical protein